jgi:Late competence development protein ComFB
MIKNIVEDVVAREYNQLRKSVQGLPDSEEFRDDVMAYALNRLAPRYVARRTGEVMSSLAMQSDQETARVSVILLEAFRVIQQRLDDPAGGAPRGPGKPGASKT